MQVQSNKKPRTFDYIQSKIHFNFNIKESTTQNEDETSETIYTYETVILDKIDRNEIIAKIIRAKYTSDAEFALINNNNLGTHLEEYKAYQDYRTIAKKKVDNTLAELTKDAAYFKFLKERIR